MSAKSGSVASSQKGEMSTGTYALNMVIQSIMWSSISFTYYVLNFMTKYYEGGIYLNYYLDGTALIIGAVIALPIYRWLKMKLSFIVAYSVILVGVIFVLCFQQNYIYPGWITCFGIDDSPHEEGSQADLDYYNKGLIPGLIFIIKIWS